MATVFVSVVSQEEFEVRESSNNSWQKNTACPAEKKKKDMSFGGFFNLPYGWRHCWGFHFCSLTKKGKCVVMWWNRFLKVIIMFGYQCMRSRSLSLNSNIVGFTNFTTSLFMKIIIIKNDILKPSQAQPGLTRPRLA